MYLVNAAFDCNAQIGLQFKIDTLVINSSHLGEKRIVWVQKPNGYDTSGKNYPVLFVLDADGHFNYVSQFIPYLHNQFNKEIPPMLIVGIPSLRRTATLTPKTGNLRYDTIAQRGEANQFLDFIENELLVQLNRYYRVTAFRVVLAHSLAGLFSIYAMHERPKLFNAVIAASSSAGYGDGILYKKFAPVFSESWQNETRYLYMAVSDSDMPNYQSENMKLADTLKKYDFPKLKWKFEIAEGLNHWTIAPHTFYKGLLYLFSEKGFNCNAK